MSHVSVKGEGEERANRYTYIVISYGSRVVAGKRQDELARNIFGPSLCPRSRLKSRAS